MCETIKISTVLHTFLLWIEKLRRASTLLYSGYKDVLFGRAMKLLLCLPSRILTFSRPLWFNSASNSIFRISLTKLLFIVKLTILSDLSAHLPMSYCVCLRICLLRCAFSLLKCNSMQLATIPAIQVGMVFNASLGYDPDEWEECPHKEQFMVFSFFTRLLLSSAAVIFVYIFFRLIENNNSKEDEKDRRKVSAPTTCFGILSRQLVLHDTYSF